MGIGGDKEAPEDQQRRPEVVQDPDEGHYPHERPLQGGWKQLPDGQWISTTEDEHKYEVICKQCGDNGGRIEDQPEPAKELRGPYSSWRMARYAWSRHKGSGGAITRINDRATNCPQ